MLVVERLVVGDARAPGVDFGAAELLGRHVLAGRGLHQRRPAEEDRARAANDDGLVAHRRHVRAAGRARAHHEGDLRDPGRGHPGLVVEDAAEVVAIGEDIGLEREEGTAAVDQVDARQPVLEGDLLRAKVLLDGHRVVGAALDRRVVGDDHACRALDPADACDDPGAGGLVVVQARGGQRAQLEERRARDRGGGRSARGPGACRVRGGGRWSGRRRRRRAPATAAWRARRSSTRAAIASWFARTSGFAGSSRLRRTGMARRIVEPGTGHGPWPSRRPCASPDPRSVRFLVPVGLSWRSRAFVAGCSSADRSPAADLDRAACDGRTSRGRVFRRSMRHDGHARTGRARPHSRKPPNDLGTVPPAALGGARCRHQDDGLRRAQSPPVHRRVPDRLRWPGGRLRVRCAGRDASGSPRARSTSTGVCRSS